MQKHVSQAVSVIFAIGAVIGFFYGKTDMAAIMLAAAGTTGLLPKGFGK